jgi:hypothetical protein
MRAGQEGDGVARRRPQRRLACSSVKTELDFFWEMLEFRIVRSGFQEEDGPLRVLR